MKKVWISLAIYIGSLILERVELEFNNLLRLSAILITLFKKLICQVLIIWTVFIIRNNSVLYHVGMVVYYSKHTQQEN